MNEPTKRDRIEALTWLGWVVASPLAILGMTMFLLSACAPVDLCPDRQCEYGYAEAPGETPEPGDKGDKGKGEKGDRDNDKGRDSEKGESDDGRGRSGKDKGDKGDDD